MSHEIMVRTALQRQEAFKNLKKNLQTIRETISKLDSNAEAYLFGSVAEGKHNFSSDIDILIITKLNPAQIHFEMWKAGIKEPFEIHVQPPERANFYTKRTKLVKI
jgi:predicted nucleotidyltransferase